MTEHLQGEPQTEPTNQDRDKNLQESTISRESTGTHGTHNKSSPIAKKFKEFFRWFKPTTPQDLWNILLVIFTGILAVVAWNQYTSDAGYLILAPILFDKATGFTEWPIENDGRRPASEVIAVVHYAYFDRAGKVLNGTVYRFTNTFPDIPAGKMPYMLAFDFPAWDSSRISRIKQGSEVARVRVALTYHSYGIRQAESRFCQETIPIRDGTDITWGPCDLLIFDRAIEGAKQAENHQKTIGGTGPAP